MKIAKFFSGIFGAIGTVLLAGSIGLCLFSLNAPARVGQIPEGAVACSAAMEEALSRQEYARLEDCIYGQPDLGLEGVPEEPLSRMVWELIQQNLTFSWQGACYMRGSALCRDASVTYMDAASITENLQTRAHALLTMRVENAENMDELYDETGEFRQDLMEEVLKAALTQCCMEDARTVTLQVTVELVNRDGQWWAVPDQALLTALSGGLA